MVAHIVAVGLGLGHVFPLGGQLAFHQLPLGLRLPGGLLPAQQEDHAARHRVGGGDQGGEHPGDAQADARVQLEDGEDQGGGVHRQAGGAGEHRGTAPAHAELGGGPEAADQGAEAQAQSVEGHEQGADGGGGIVAPVEKHLGEAAGKGQQEHEIGSVHGEHEQAAHPAALRQEHIGRAVQGQGKGGLQHEQHAHAVHQQDEGHRQEGAQGGHPQPRPAAGPPAEAAGGDQGEQQRVAQKAEGEPEKQGKKAVQSLFLPSRIPGEEGALPGVFSTSYHISCRGSREE